MNYHSFLPDPNTVRKSSQTFNNAPGPPFEFRRYRVKNPVLPHEVLLWKKPFTIGGLIANGRRWYANGRRWYANGRRWYANGRHWYALKTHMAIHPRPEERGILAFSRHEGRLTELAKCRPLL